MNKSPLSGLDALYQAIVTVPDFPKSGILFRDISFLLNSSALLQHAITQMLAPVEHLSIQKVLAMESRGFLFAVPIALHLNAGVVLARKPGKLPPPYVETQYALEYGENTIQIPETAVQAGEHVLIVDDVLATGGTANAAHRLVEQLGGVCVAHTFLLELASLGGRQCLQDAQVWSVLKYA